LKNFEIIIFNNLGKPIGTSNNSSIFKEKILSAGLLYSIGEYITKLFTEKVNSLTLEKHKIVFERLKEITGAIVLNIGENERAASNLLKKILKELYLKGLDNINQINDILFNNIPNFGEKL